MKIERSLNYRHRLAKILEVARLLYCNNYSRALLIKSNSAFMEVLGKLDKSYADALHCYNDNDIFGIQKFINEMHGTEAMIEEIIEQEAQAQNKKKLRLM